MCACVCLAWLGPDPGPRTHNFITHSMQNGSDFHKANRTKIGKEWVFAAAVWVMGWVLDLFVKCYFKILEIIKVVDMKASIRFFFIHQMAFVA